MLRRLSILLMFAATGTTAGVAFAAPPASSTYFTDAQSSYVQDATSDSVGSVNMITCIMSSMRPDALVNQGPYIALVDQNVCNAAKAGAATSGTSASAAQAPDYMTAVVNSTRTSNSDPMIVTAWISIGQHGTPETVFAHISVTAAATATDPYGAFRLDYCGKLGSDSACEMNGFLQAGNGTLSYYETETANGSGNGGGQTRALQLSSVGTTSGSGSVAVQQSGNGSSSSAFNFAYDQSYYLRSDLLGDSECFSRDATDPATGFSVWQYGLYDAATGARIQRNSGFPIQYTSGGTSYQGFVGYYGLSVQPGAPLPANGSAVQKVDYSNGSASTTSYTAVTYGGRLTRYTQETRTLQSISQLPFNVFIGAVNNFGLPDPNTQYVMYWDDASAKFIATAEMQCNQSGCQTNNLAQPLALDPSLWASVGGVLQGFSQSLGGNLSIDLSGVSGAINSSAITVVYDEQDLVYPNDPSLPATLYCASNCPTAASLQAYFTQGQGNPVASPYVAATYNNFQPVLISGLTQYSVAGAILTDGNGQAVVDTNSNDYAQYPQYQNGVMSGVLFVNPGDALCPDHAVPSDYCANQASLASVYYVWQTGPGSYSQFAAVKDSTGAFVQFDAPLNVNFTVPTGAAYGSYAGTSLILQYNGFGDLWGIPSICVSQTTNLPDNCNDANALNVPQFIIPYDPTASPQQGVVSATTSGNVTTTYLVKWQQRQIRFANKGLSVCTNDKLAVPTNIVLPTAAGLQDPSQSTSSVYLGPEPAVTAAPRVIQGVVEY
jgi:hypothetical protein